MKKLMAVALVIAAGALGAAPAALADDDDDDGGHHGFGSWYRCEGVVGPIEVKNLYVPPGAVCILEGTQVRGDAVALPHAAALFIGPESRIGDDVTTFKNVQTLMDEGKVGDDFTCYGCEFTDMTGSWLGGTLKVKGEQQGSLIAANEIRRDLVIEDSEAGLFGFAIEGNTVGGDIKFEDNEGPAAITGNIVKGDLEIVKNNVEGAFCPPDAPPEECPFFENLTVTENEVGDDLELEKNRGPSELVGNIIRDELECERNSPPPVGAGNVARRKSGQCRNL